MADGDAVWRKLDQHGEQLARHDAEIESLRASTVRLEQAVAEVREELRDMKGEITSRMDKGFSRVEAAVTTLTRAAMEAYPPTAAQEIANARAGRAAAQAWTVALMTALVGALAIIAALLVGKHP